MSDLVERIRGPVRMDLSDAGKLVYYIVLALEASDEIDRLTEQLRLTQIDWNNVATENAGLRAVVDAAEAWDAEMFNEQIWHETERDLHDALTKYRSRTVSHE